MGYDRGVEQTLSKDRRVMETLQVLIIVVRLFVWDNCRVHDDVFFCITSCPRTGEDERGEQYSTVSTTAVIE